jgi:uncharacterized protein (DUF433 family)
LIFCWRPVGRTGPERLDIGLVIGLVIGLDIGLHQLHQPDQVVLEEVLRLDRLRSRITRAAERQADDAGQVVKKRGVHASAPVFAGTRIRVSTVQDYLRHGYETGAILEAFPDLSAADVAEASRLLAAAG